MERELELVMRRPCCGCKQDAVPRVTLSGRECFVRRHYKAQEPGHNRECRRRDVIQT